MVSIDKDPKLLYYFKKRHLEKETKTSYTNCFKNYYKVTGLTPTEAIYEADYEEDEGIRKKKRKITKYLDDFEDHLEANMSEKTLQQYMNIVRTFYKFNEIELPISIRRSPNPTPETSLEDIPNVDDIQKAISFSDIKYNAFIILLASSGMRQGDARSLILEQLVNALNMYAEIKVNDLSNIGEVKDLLPKTIGPIRWDFWMEKKKRKHSCFSTPESLKYILRYLEHHPPKKFEDDTFLFRNYQKGKGVVDGFIGRRSFNSAFRDINRRCNWGIRPNGYIFFNPHILRSWFANQGAYSDLGQDNTRLLMGHRVKDATGKAYIKPNYKVLYKLYYEFMDEFTIFNRVEVHDITDERVKTLESENKEMKKRLDALERGKERKDRLKEI
jgi:integrase